VVLTAFDTTWDLLKSDFYFGSDNPYDEGGFHSTGGWTTGMKGADKLKFRGKEYLTGVNLNHPIYNYKDWLGNREQNLTDDERIKQIIDTIVHEEGHQAIWNPLVETNNLEFEDAGYEPKYFSESYPNSIPQEYGAMLIEGMRHPEIMDELRRRKFITS
jgi:hypothetical protein